MLMDQVCLVTFMFFHHKTILVSRLVKLWAEIDLLNHIIESETQKIEDENRP